MSLWLADAEPDFLSEIAIPERSALFSLQPVGIGTPNQESLLSLLVRTSYAHAVNPRLLIREVFPMADATIARLPTAAFFQRMAGTINGLGQYAEIFVSAMEKLSGQPNLSHLTFLPWKSLFPHNGQGLLARHLRWCPICLEEQYREKGEAAFPLVWSLEAYQVCQIHRVPLEHSCSSCGKMQSFIPSFPNLALCAHCRHPFGGVRNKATNPIFKTWMAEAVGDMVSRQSLPGFAPTRERFLDFVREQVAVHAGGNRAAFCRAIGLNEFGVSGWLNKGERPSITQFLTVCYGTNTLPIEIFHAADQPAQMAGLRMLAGKLKERAAPPRLAPARRVAVEKILQEHLNTGAGQSVSVIAKELGVGRACLRYWFSDLCKSLSEQHQSIAKKQSDDRHRQQCMLVEEVISKIRTEGSQPTKRKVNKLLRDKGITLSQPHLISTYRECLAFDLSLLHKLSMVTSMHRLMTRADSINTGLECKFYNEENMSKDKGKDKDKDTDKKDISLKIVVSGTEITLEANPHQTLGSLIEKALKAAGEASQPDQWGFFVQKGGEMVSVDSNMKVEDAAKQHELLYLNKKAGAAG